MRKINVAIDGHSSCGKSTIAKALAKKLNYFYVDSGAMYRSLTHFALQHKLIEYDKVKEVELLKSLPDVKIHFEKVDGKQHAFLNDVDIEFDIRSPEVSNYVSQVAKIPEVRSFLVKQQKKIGVDKGVVMDGRDIGTVVFPGAELKFFVTARVEVRAQRRYDEMLAKGYTNISMEDIKSNIEERDFVDSHRLVSPLIQANDAILIDTSDLSPEEQLEIVFKRAEKVINES
jgi:cytidylate kinase